MLPAIKKSNENEAYWFQLIENWESSGKKQKTFCKEHQISISTFAYWRSRYLAKKNNELLDAPVISTNKPEIGFLPIKQSETTPKERSPIQAKLSSGIVLLLPQSMPISDIVYLLKGLS